MGEVIDFNGLTILDTDSEKVLEAAKEYVEEVLVIGYDGKGELYVAASNSSKPEMIWLLELAKKFFLEL